MEYKYSYYNSLISIPEKNEFILYNSLSGGLLILTEEEGLLIEKISKLDTFNLSDFLDFSDLLESLIDKKNIVKRELDEFELYKKTFKQCMVNSISKSKGFLSMTIATTMKCNMACKYCFEFQKENKYFDDKKVELFEPFFKSIISNSNVDKWKEIKITWYGGEPLLNTKAIEQLSGYMMNYAKDNGLNYSASIVTNGILLNKPNWDILVRNNVKHVQVTIDGPRDCHDIRRPLKNKNALNYERIIENLTNIPDGMKVTIRVNIDKTVASRFEELLADLDKNKIWPERYRDVSIDCSLLRTYSEANESNLSLFDRIKFNDFSLIDDDLRMIKLNYFNNWAKLRNIQKAKLYLSTPKPLFYECLSFVNDSSIFVLSADGYLYPCWEKIHDKPSRIQHMSKEYNVNNFNKTSLNDRFEIEKCRSCKFLPICGMAYCRHHLNETSFCECPFPDEESFKKGIKSKYLKYCNSNIEYVENSPHHYILP